MSSSSSAPCWRSAPVDAIAWREWDGEFVVRNERSGSSHLLASLAGRVLEILLDAEGGLRVAEIAVKLCDKWPNEFGPAADVAEVDAAIESVLAEFHRLGLAEPEPR